MKKVIVATLIGLVLTGCATAIGKQRASQVNKFLAIDSNGDGIADLAGTLTVKRQFDSATGMLLSEERTLTHVLYSKEKDKSNLGARGLLAIQAVEGFEHSRTGFTGSSSTSGAKVYKGDADEKAIGAAGTAAGNVIGAAGNSLINP